MDLPVISAIRKMLDRGFSVDDALFVGEVIEESLSTKCLSCPVDIDQMSGGRPVDKVDMSSGHDVDAAAENRRAYDRQYKRQTRAAKRSAADVFTSCPVDKVDSPVDTSTKGFSSPIPKETSPLHPPKEITLTPTNPQNAFDQNPDNPGWERASTPRAREANGWPKDAFQQFWRAYPHKVGKDAAEPKFDRIRKSGKVEFDRLMEGLRRYIASKPPDRSWCNPATWLNQGRWDDQPAIPSFTANPSASGAYRNEKSSGLGAALDRLQARISGQPDHGEGELSRSEDFGF